MVVSEIADVWLSILSFWNWFSFNKRLPNLNLLLPNELLSCETWLLSPNILSYYATLILLLASNASFSFFFFFSQVLNISLELLIYFFLVLSSTWSAKRFAYSAVFCLLKSQNTIHLSFLARCNYAYGQKAASKRSCTSEQRDLIWTCFFYYWMIQMWHVI